MITDEKKAQLQLAGIAIAIISVIGGLIGIAWLGFSQGDNSEEKSLPTVAPIDKPKEIDPSSFEWVRIAGRQMPLLDSLATENARGQQFVQTEEGAGLAALHYFNTLSPDAGESVFVNSFNRDVVTGPEKDAALATTQERISSIQDPSDYSKLALVVGWTVTDYSNSQALVNVYFFDGDRVGYPMVLLWVDNNWKVKAPEVGIWEDYSFDANNELPSMLLYPNNPDIGKENVLEGTHAEAEDLDEVAERSTEEYFAINATTKDFLAQFATKYLEYDYGISYEEKIEDLTPFLSEALRTELSLNPPLPEAIQNAQKEKLTRKVSSIKKIERLSEPNFYHITATFYETRSDKTSSATQIVLVEVEKDDNGDLLIKEVTVV